MTKSLGDRDLFSDLAKIRPLIGSGAGVGDIEGVTAGAGLTGGGTSGTVTLDVVAAASSGLTVNADDMTITLQSPSGLDLAAGGLAIADSIAGTGINIAAKVLSVDYTATGFSGLAGDGLVWDAGNTEIDVGAGNGITVNANDVALTLPGTLSVLSTNDPSGNHTHGITTTADATISPTTILAGDANGDIALRRLTIDDQILHDGDADTYFEFTADQADFYIGGINTISSIPTTLTVSGEFTYPSTYPMKIIGKGTDEVGPAVQLLVQNTAEEPVATQDYENEVHIRLQAGSSADHRKYINFADYNGVDKWLTGSNAQQRQAQRR
jgi:hypothetical protein